MSFVLVHGAGYGASCWDELVPLLEHDTLAVDLPGRGSRAGTDLTRVTLQDCADAVVADVESRDLTDVVLVGHSFAGVTVPRIMTALGGRIRRVVLLSAVVPPDGTRVLDQIDPDVRGLVEQSLAGGIYHQERVAAHTMLCNDMDEATATAALDRLVDDSAALLSEPVDLAGYASPIPRTYIRLTADHCYTPDLQERSVALTSADVEWMKTGHLAMISAPTELAALLNRLHG
ncbi:alpha/beta fold hydrolase [Pseudonocardia sp. RS11V-5]|uniref:alpha/beta fold hydrolase n=1 Tax=Pseudonocardia terrae TaxID=2905831 RepID=UPI001E49D3E0|nr:alpha/beta hydrolase [Pseudonocardia terrae]MCE3552351.1 alpha/beta fold hydrolase [Pseudonocardia terrae]